MACGDCKWRHPDTCRMCSIGKEELRVKEGYRPSIVQSTVKKE